jgi:hypothetical protein
MTPCWDCGGWGDTAPLYFFQAGEQRGRQIVANKVSRVNGKGVPVCTLVPKKLTQVAGIPKKVPDPMGGVSYISLFWLELHRFTPEGALGNQSAPSLQYWHCRTSGQENFFLNCEGITNA